MRWPSPELIADWSQGVQLVTIQELARYWATGYDWPVTVGLGLLCLATVHALIAAQGLA